MKGIHVVNLSFFNASSLIIKRRIIGSVGGYDEDIQK